MQRKRKWKWEIEGYQDKRGENKIFLEFTGLGEKYWYVREENEGREQKYATLEQAKEALRKAGYLEELKPYDWWTDLEVETPKGDSAFLTAEVEKTTKGDFFARVDTPILEIGQFDEVIFPTLHKAKQACEALLNGVLRFLEIQGWKVKE